LEIPFCALEILFSGPSIYPDPPETGHHTRELPATYVLGSKINTTTNITTSIISTSLLTFQYKQPDRCPVVSGRTPVARASWSFWEHEKKTKASLLFGLGIRTLQGYAMLPSSPLRLVSRSVDPHLFT
jgi:hypothetical protein